MEIEKTISSNHVIRDRLKGALTGLIIGRRIKYRFENHKLQINLENPEILDMIFCSQTIFYIESFLNWLEKILDNSDFFNSNSTDILIEAYDKWVGYIKGRSNNAPFWHQTEENAWLNEYMHSIAQWVKGEGAKYFIDFYEYQRDRALITAGAICSVANSFDFMGEMNRKAWIHRLCCNAYGKVDANKKDYMLIWFNIMYVIINIEKNIYANEADDKRTLIGRITAAAYIGSTPMGYGCFMSMCEYAKTSRYPTQQPYSYIASEILEAFRQCFSRMLSFHHADYQIGSFNGMLYGFERMNEIKNEIPFPQIDYIDKLADRIICMRERIDAFLSADNGRLRNYIASL